jgi:hypothetical protein
MGGIFGVAPEEQNAAGDRVALEHAPRANPFAPAVVLEKTLAEIGARIGLPPVEIAGQRRVARRAYEEGDDGKRARH